jgi:YD repeat-containing protein
LTLVQKSNLKALAKVTDAAGNVTIHTYDTENNLLAITDANGRTTNFT